MVLFIYFISPFSISSDLSSYPFLAIAEKHSPSAAPVPLARLSSSQSAASASLRTPHGCERRHCERAFYRRSIRGIASFKKMVVDHADAAGTGPALPSHAGLKSVIFGFSPVARAVPRSISEGVQRAGGTDVTQDALHPPPKTFSPQNSKNRSHTAPVSHFVQISYRYSVYPLLVSMEIDCVFPSQSTPKFSCLPRSRSLK